MNKYTKNQIWFNLEKIISIVIAMSIITLTAALMSSCTTTQDIVHSHTLKYPCPTFKNK